MKIMPTRRVAAVLIAPALAVGTLAAAPSAQAAPNSAETAVASWLAAQVPDDTHLFESHYSDGTNNVPFTDYGLNLDLYAALDTLGERETAGDVFDATVAHADAYTDSSGTRYAGAMGKLTAMVQRHDETTTAVVGDRKLVAELEAMVLTEGAAAGRAEDVFKDPDDSENYETSNAIGQSWVVRALATAGSDLDDETTAYLLKQQCDDGSFRLTMGDAACTTGSGSPETTSFAVQALDVAKGEGVEGLDDDIAEAVEWLVAKQGADGSYSDEGAGTANTNSTGLAAAALKAHDRAGPAGSAAGWVAGRQVPSGDEAGAIALNDADLAAADDIGVVARDRYVRASVQASLGLSALLPDAAINVTRPTQFVSAGKSVTISATGFEPFEKVTFAMQGVPAAPRTASDLGKAAASIKTPTTSGTRTVRATGSTAGRTGTTKVTVLAARTFRPKLRYTSVKLGKSQQVTVSGLAGGEPVKIYFSGKLIKTATASASGTYSHYFKVKGVAKGKRTVKVNGAFTNRTGSKTFQVK